MSPNDSGFYATIVSVMVGLHVVLAVFVFILWKEGLPDWREEKRVAHSLFHYRAAGMGQGCTERGSLLSVFKKKGGLSFIYFCLSRAEGSGEEIKYFTAAYT